MKVYKTKRWTGAIIAFIIFGFSPAAEAIGPTRTTGTLSTLRCIHDHLESILQKALGPKVKIASRAEFAGFIEAINRIFAQETVETLQGIIGHLGGLMGTIPAQSDTEIRPTIPALKKPVTSKLAPPIVVPQSQDQKKAPVSAKDTKPAASAKAPVKPAQAKSVMSPKPAPIPVEPAPVGLLPDLVAQFAEKFFVLAATKAGNTDALNKLWERGFNDVKLGEDVKVDDIATEAVKVAINDAITQDKWGVLRDLCNLLMEKADEEIAIGIAENTIYKVIEQGKWGVVRDLFELILDKATAKDALDKESVKEVRATFSCVAAALNSDVVKILDAAITVNSKKIGTRSASNSAQFNAFVAAKDVINGRARCDEKDVAVLKGILDGTEDDEILKEAAEKGFKDPEKARRVLEKAKVDIGKVVAFDESKGIEDFKQAMVCRLHKILEEKVFSDMAATAIVGIVTTIKKALDQSNWLTAGCILAYIMEQGVKEHFAILGLKDYFEKAINSVNSPVVEDLVELMLLETAKKSGNLRLRRSVYKYIAAKVPDRAVDAINNALNKAVVFDKKDEAANLAELMWGDEKNPKIDGAAEVIEAGFNNAVERNKWSAIHSLALFMLNKKVVEVTGVISSVELALNNAVESDEGEAAANLAKIMLRDDVNRPKPVKAAFKKAVNLDCGGAAVNLAEVMLASKSKGDSDPKPKVSDPETTIKDAFAAINFAATDQDGDKIKGIAAKRLANFILKMKITGAVELVKDAFTKAVKLENRIAARNLLEDVIRWNKTSEEISSWYKDASDEFYKKWPTG